MRRGGRGCLLNGEAWVSWRAAAMAACLGQAEDGGLVPGRFIVAAAIDCDDLS
jgi:hypothetical protein